ncbi:MFS transporter [Mycoplasmatota bacterium WC44]
MNKLKNKIYFLSILFLLYFIVILEVVAIPSIAISAVDYLGINQSQITYITTGFNLAGIFAPFFGFYGDKVGKKKVMILGIILFIIGTYLTSNVTTLLGFILARSITGLGYYTFISLLFAYIGDFIPYKDRGKVSGLLKGAFALAVLLAPIYSGSIIIYFNLSYIYRFISIAASVLLVFLLTLPESVSTQSRSIDITVFKKFLVNKDILKFIIVQFLYTIPGILFFSYFAFHLSSIGLVQTDISKIFVLIAVGSLMAGFVVYFLSDKIGKIKLIMLAFFVSALGMIFLTSTNIVIIICFLIVFLLGYDVIQGLYLTVCGEIFEKERATFISMLGFVMALSQFLLSILAPIINRIGGYNLNIIVGTGSLAIAAVMFYGLYIKYRSRLN